eukprot:TRINITY_DN8566_c1_g1_i2.p1 TRINITY_DN8566_c1_g1~~TRINITY_DN8566_c1_g1_i2.p1  ORF type:complete len:233 (-),score=55.37 TRINITY_DN8566_c1_g1_i2:69-767(-)
MVIFDLSGPPHVITANYVFCDLFGYDEEKIKGMNWNQFIHPHYLDRTMEIFRSDSLPPSLEFMQVYQRKNGQPFMAWDTHKFILGNNGRPLTDFVTITPAKYHMNSLSNVETNPLAIQLYNPPPTVTQNNETTATQSNYGGSPHINTPTHEIPNISTPTHEFPNSNAFGHQYGMENTYPENYIDTNMYNPEMPMGWENQTGLGMEDPYYLGNEMNIDNFEDNILGEWETQGW